uniref:Neurotransmitter-gated ion-channel ligand-binding domain-containing protein n=1 Tax=Plectus sambesii TaxID=2011161 RepID=A0A914WFX9_9BILA
MPAYNLGAKGYPYEVHNGQGESYPLGCSSHYCQRDYGKKHHRLLQRKECPCGGNNRKKLTPEILERIEEVIEDCPATSLKQIKWRLKENQTWHDEIVKWNRTAYSDIDLVVIPASLLWKPDIVVTTSLETDYRIPEENRFVTVSGDGTVQSAAPCIITNQCVLDIHEFPFDVQECNITFGSWMYDSSKIDLEIGKHSHDGPSHKDRKGNGEWTLLSMEPVVNHYHSGDGKNWAEVTYVIRLKREPIYYTCVLLMPTFLSATICLLGLFVPASSKGERIEKVNMGLATLLSMAMILGIVAEEMPKTNSLPLLGMLCFFGIGLISWKSLFF